MNISSVAVFQQNNVHLKDEELHLHFLQQTSPSVLKIFEITHKNLHLMEYFMGFLTWT